MTLRSLWQDRDVQGRRSAERASDSDLASVEGDWDVVVVGAGITGLTTALLLGRGGMRVLVLEAEHVGAGTTGRSTAKISLAQGTQLSRVARQHSSGIVSDYVAANLTAQTWLADFCAESDVTLQQRTAYTYATTARGESAARRELGHARRAGLDVSWTDDPPLPYATRGALALPGQLQVDPVALLDALAGAAAAHGVVVLERTRVRSVTGRTPARVETDRGVVTAAAVVVATNAPILDRGGYFARVSAARSYTVAYRTSAAAVAGMFLSTDEPSRSLRDVVGADSAGLLVGGNGHVTGRSGSPRRRLDEIRTWTRHHLGDLEETHAWSAQDYVPHHALPYAGPLVPGREDVVFAGGYSKWGMTNGVAAAHVLAARLVGDLPAWARVFATWAPRELTGLPVAARANGSVGLALTAGWVRPLLHGATAPEEGQGRVARGRLGVPVAVSTVDGAARRVSAVCTHLGGIVGWNDAERSWDCPLHGSRFDADGGVLEGVATCGLRRHDR